VVPVELNPILTAALDAFDEEGYHGATVRDIARRVGVTVPALYYHYENKQAILFALLDTSVSALVEHCETADDEAADPQDRFDAVVEVLVRYTAVSGKLSRLDVEMRSLSADDRRTYTDKRAQIQARVLAVVEEGARVGRFDVTYPRETVRALLGMIQSIPTWYRLAGTLALDDLVERYLEISHRMVGLAAQ
jgi:TetR/AcrR family transcriptional regulator, cholesterol catabolism regulator